MPPLLLALTLVASQTDADDPKALAAKARAVFEAHCYRCHGKDGKRSGGFGYALDAQKMIDNKVVVPGKLDDGVILRIKSRDEADMMPPPEVKERPSAAEVAAVEAWIKAGAPAFPPAAAVAEKARPQLTEKDAYRAMAEYLRKLPREDAKYRRFVTLTHLHNDPDLDARTLRLYHAAVSKLLNSLSWRRGVVLPKIIDAHGAVLCIDLRDLDWDVRDAWRLLVARDDGRKVPGYPYALTHDRYPEERDLNADAGEVYRLTGTRIPAVRADWLLAAAALPPLYNDLLHLPTTAGELEKRLGVDIAANFRRGALARAGLAVSGVAAKANRLIERHEANYGAYWKSYDFASSAGASSLTKLPLGPLSLFPVGRHPYEAAAFKHDGGEIIFNLPNGLQGYLLVDAENKRIDRAPPIVRDDKETAGEGTVIVNGLSCMACHKHGLITKDVKDFVRDGAGLEGDELAKVRRLYPREADMNRLFKRDTDLFLRSLEEATGSYLRLGGDEKKPIEAFPEPVSALASPYLKSNLTLAQAARELGMDPAALKVAIENNPTLRNTLGLRPLTNGGTIKREAWEAVGDSGDTLFQAAAAELKRGSGRVEKR